MSARTNIAIVSGGGFQGSALIKSLTPVQSFRIVLLDCYEENINRYFVDEFYRVPLLVQEDKFISELQTIVADENISVVFPSTEYELPVLSRHRIELESTGMKLAVCGPEILGDLSDKKLFYARLRQLGLPTLESYNGEDNSSAIFPLIGKPRKGWGARDIIIAKDQNEFLKLEKNSPETHVWQKFLAEFEEYSFDFGIGFDGSISPIVSRKRVKTLSGFAVVSDSENIPEIELHVRSLAAWLAQNNGVGLFNVQALCEPDGKFYFSDMNPRIGTSAVHGLGEGINLPKFVVESASQNTADRKPGNATNRKRVRMVRQLQEHYLPILDTAKIKGVVFDLDDTLIDHKRWIVAKLNGLWNELRLELPEFSRFMKTALRLVEEGPRDTLLDRLMIELDLRPDLRMTMIETYRHFQPSDIAVYSDAIRCIEQLREQSLALGLLTENPVVSQQQKLDVFPYTADFDQIIFCRDVGVEKPNPKPFELMAERLDLAPDQLIMVGDNLYRDVLGALSADYNCAVWLDRKASFFNFDQTLFSESYPEFSDSYYRVSTLTELSEMLHPKEN